MVINRSAVRALIYRHLFPGAWTRQGLSPANTAIVALILFAGLVACLETEQTITEVPEAARALSLLNAMLAILFSVEYGARVWAAGEEERYRGLLGRLRFMCRPTVILDLLAILPFYLSLGIGSAYFLRLFRLLRIVMLARLGEFSEAARLLGEGIHTRRHELLLALSAAAFVLLVSAVALHVTEGNVNPAAFGSIPRALWWSIVTLTTVGYGDVYPVTLLGRVFGGVTAIAGIGLIAMPTGILAAAFSDVFQRRTRNRDSEATD